jgi:hypothetical protein
MEEEFYSTIKLVSGEEIIAKVCYLPEENSLLIEQPLRVEYTNKKSGTTSDGFMLKEWIHSTYDTMFVIPKESIITMSELDKRIERFYLTFLNKDEPSAVVDIKPNKLSKQMGYLGSVNETKKYLEDIFKRS